MCDMAEINTFIQECSAFVTCSGLNVVVQWLSHVQLIVAPWTAAHQAPPSMGFSRQEYWSGLPLPSPYIYIYVSIYTYVYTYTHMYP